MSLRIFEGICPRFEVIKKSTSYPSAYHQQIIRSASSVLDEKGIKVLSYLRGRVDLSDLGITKEKANDFLQSVKAVDQLFQILVQKYGLRINTARSSYDLRTHILEVSSPEMESFDAYTKTISRTKMKNPDYLKDPRNWVAERIGFLTQHILCESVRVMTLSKKFPTNEPRIFVLRGNTAVGKTTFAKKIFYHLLDEQGTLLGCINLESSKSHLKGVMLTNMQVHREASYGPLRLLRDEMIHSKIKESIIYDSRLISYDEFEESVIVAAKKRNSKAFVIDVDDTLTRSLIRTLSMRKPKGKEACVHPEAIVKGFQKIKYKKRILERVKTEPLISYYDLYYQGKLVALKRENVFTILSETEFDECCRVPNFEEIEREKRELITSEFIERAVERGDILSQNKVELQKWLGISLYQACEFHAMGIEKDIALQHILEDRHYNKLYGKTTILPFTCSWLEDFPHIYEHLVSEHLLHVRGVDDTGRGLHWKEGNFDWKLNPQFNPEMTIGKSQGFQMKLGYFIVPLDKIEAHRAQNLSELVAKELEVRDAAGSVIGLRFFVHPEGYHHFRPLHDANIPFVKSEESEYMGTPTSSYRSWTIRRVKRVDDNFVAEDNTLPFIVKLGVLGTLFDNSRLLPRMEIEKSLEVQAAFDSLEKNDHLLIFPENLGLVLKDIPNYPKANLWSMPQVDSGLIIREFPKEFLAGNCKILSFSALMSVERANKENNGVCSFQKEGFEALPLLFEIIDQTIKRGLVKSAQEFVQKHLIKQFFSTIEPLVFQKGLSLPLHGQNLMMVVSNDGIPLGFALRDLSDVYQNGQRYLETYTWFYRYHVFTKLFNVITASKNDLIAPPIGAPSQIGSPVIQPERSLYFYLIHEKVNDRALPILQALSLQANEYNTMHRLLDQGYLQYLKRYFAVSRAKILQNGLLPAAEVYSIQGCLHLHNQNLWKERYDIDGLEKLFQKLNITS